MNSLLTLQDVYDLRDYFVEYELGLVFYNYQTEISNKIIEALLTRSGEEIPIEISRQAGKTEAIVCTLAFLMVYAKSLSKRFWGYEAAFRFIIFSPQKEQAKTDFDRLKSYLLRLKNNGWGHLVNEKESNQTTLQIANGSYCYIFPLTPTSNPESKSADMIIYEEAHKIIDAEKKNKAEPMGASTNAPQISIGVSWYQKNYFKNLIDANPKHPRYDAPAVIAEREAAYRKDGNPRHLLYKRHFEGRVAMYGLEDIAIQTQYLLKWHLEAGQFMTADDWTAMTKPYLYLGKENEKLYMTPKLLDQDLNSDCFAGIDTAKHPDSTVVTIVRWNEQTQWKELVALLELHGVNYAEQFTIISGFDTVQGKKTGKGMFDYFNVVGMGIDSTGQGSFMPDMFKAHTKFRDERSGLFEVKFSLQSKDMIYTTLMQTVSNRLTAIPADDTLELRRMRKQLLDLEKEYKGQFLSVHHPEDEAGQTYHDDYCFIAGTKILTENGHKNIEDIKEGDKVMTRKGLKKVIQTGSRMTKTISRFGITGTPNHPFFTKNGIKRFDLLNESDIIYMWNERRSSTEEKNITDIQIQKEGSLESIFGDMISGKARQLHFIVKYGLITMEKYLKAWLSIIGMKIRSIMKLETLSLKLEQSIKVSMPASQIGWLRLKKVLKKPWSLLRNGMAALRALRGIGSMQSTPSSKDFQRVYNLQIEDQHEYFVNNVLVHNCDAFALSEHAFAMRQRIAKPKVRSV